ncbi:MAG: thiosulfate sulfurtransferase GlpE [Pseudohongiellaceae bacterium]
MSLSQEKAFSFRDDHKPSYTSTLSVDQFLALESTSELILLDVRLAEDFQKDPKLIPGAQYKDPESLPHWINQLDQSKEIVVYCVAGRWVSQKVAFLLSEAGLKVRSLEGGIEAWKKESNKLN